MGKKSLTEIRKQDFIFAFIEVASKKGISNVTTRELTRATGLSPGMMNYHFNSKDNMFIEVMRYIIDTTNAQLREELSECGSATEMLEVAFNWAFYLDPEGIERGWLGLMVEFWGLANAKSAISEFVKKAYENWTRELEGIIRMGIESGEFKNVDARVMAITITASVEGAIAMWIIDPDRMPLKSTIKQEIEVFMDFLLQSTNGEEKA